MAETLWMSIDESFNIVRCQCYYCQEVGRKTMLAVLLPLELAPQKVEHVELEVIEKHAHLSLFFVLFFF